MCWGSEITGLRVSHHRPHICRELSSECERFTKLLHHGGTARVRSGRSASMISTSVLRRSGLKNCARRGGLPTSEPREVGAGGKNRRLGLEQLPGVRVPASSAGAGKLSGMAADDQLFPFSDPLIRTSRMSGARGWSHKPAAERKTKRREHTTRVDSCGRCPEEE